MKKVIDFLWFLLIGGLLVSCDLFKSDELVEEETKSLVQVINENADLSMFKSAFERNPDLLDDLGDLTSEFTVFAPSNQAFEDFIESMEGVNSMSDLEDEVLLDFIEYHVISGTVLRLGDMVSGDSPATLLGEFINMVVNGNAVKLNDIADISSPDVEAENGVIHVIDAVLLPRAYLPLENEFMYKGERYSLGWGFYYNYGANSGYTNYDLIMTEVEENLNEVEETDDLLSDHFIYLWLESEGASFTEGRFEFNENGFDEGVEKFIYSGNVWLRGLEEEIEIDGGYVDIAIEGDIYTVTMELTLVNGEDLKAHISYPFKEQENEDGGSGEITNTGDDYQSDYNIYVEEVRFPVSQSNVIDYGDFDGSGYNIDIELFSRDPDAADLTGAHYFYIELFSESTEEFIDGEYVFDDTYTAGENHFGYSVFNINVNQGTENTLYINSGVINVSTSDNVLDITFELTDQYDRTITGLYQGDLNISKNSNRSKTAASIKSKLRVKNRFMKKKSF